MAGRLSALVAAVALLVAAAPAPAHQGDPAIVARIDAVEPPIEGVAVLVRAGAADQLLLVNSTADDVEVLGEDGEPFLRVGRDSVRADVSSEAWRRSAGPFGAAAPAPAGATWVTVADHGSWGWFDHRLHPVDRAVTPDLRASKRPVRLADWTVPLRHRGRTHVVKGHVEYRPVVGQFRSRVTTRPDGVDVDVLDGRVPGLFVRWHGEGTLLVKGMEGEPFARFSRTGVEVNETSVTWRDDRALRDEPVAPGTAARWVAQGPSPSLTWLDRRLAYAPGVPPDGALRSDEPTTVVEWDVPVVVAGREQAIAGETTWHPNAASGGGDGRRVAMLAAAAAAVAVAIAFAVARGRRRRRVEP
ncbi:MAG TPA: hypothetical protein VGX28_06715 [Frankiaceae bacterium]|nr:hypothetical protein [Frankiaceae bacterium]